jgi:hypothetical protein
VLRSTLGGATHYSYRDFSMQALTRVVRGAVPSLDAMVLKP